MRPLFLSTALLTLTMGVYAQTDKRLAPACIGWYNVENLYDTIDSPDTEDAEWLPSAQDGNFKGYPFRICVGDNFTGGFSDHFPVFTILVKDAAPGQP